MAGDDSDTAKFDQRQHVATAPIVADARSGDERHHAYIYMDAMRALLALAVAYGHIWALFIQDYDGKGRWSERLLVDGLYYAAGFAHAAVVIFFVLSGYWIAKSVDARMRAGWSWRGYLADRTTRLMVVLLPALALGGLLDATSIWMFQSPTHLRLTDTWVLRKDVITDLSPVTLLGNMVFLQDILVSPYGTNGPLWSLASEFWYYIWFPAIWLTLRLRRLSWACASFALAILAPHLAAGFLAWMCGALLHFATDRPANAGAQSRKATKRRLLLAGGAFLIVLAGGRMGDFVAEDILLAVAAAVFFHALLQRDPHPFLGVRTLATYGAATSFSLYAIHFPILAFAAAFLVPVERLSPTFGNIAIAAVVLGLTVLAAKAFSDGTEAHTAGARKIARRLLGIRLATRRDDHADTRQN